MDSEAVGNAETLERAGQWALAAEAYQELFRRAVAERRVDETVRALSNVALMRQRQECYDEAEELAETSREIAERNGLVQSAARAVNILALSRHGRHDWSGAWTLYGRALQVAQEIDDDVLVGWTCQNMGVIANIRGDLHQARDLYLEGVCAALRSGDRTSAIRAYNNLGMVHTDLQEWMEADACFERGIEMAEQADDRALLGKLWVNRAEPLIQMGEQDRAWQALDRAEEIASWTEDRGVLVDVERFRGRLTRVRGNLHAAGMHLDRALALADDPRLRLERAEALEETALLRRDGADAPAARAALREAAREYRALGAERDARRAEELLARWETEAASAGRGRWPPRIERARGSGPLVPEAVTG